MTSCAAFCEAQDYFTLQEGASAMVKVRDKINFKRRPPKVVATVERVQYGIFRATVLEVVNESPKWLTGHEVATLAKLTYRQTINALNELKNFDKVARKGRTFSARWGPLHLASPHPVLDTTLEQLFRGFVVKQNRKRNKE